MTRYEAVLWAILVGVWTALAVWWTSAMQGGARGFERFASARTASMLSLAALATWIAVVMTFAYSWSLVIALLVVGGVAALAWVTWVLSSLVGLVRGGAARDA